MTQFMNIDFPFHFDHRHRTAATDNDDHIRDMIEQFLLTNPGERVMRPDFGAGLQAFIFELANTTTMALVRHRVQEALVTWEPRIDVLDVRVEDGGEVGAVLVVFVDYRIRANNAVHNLVYPLYATEGVSAAAAGSA